MTVNGVLGWSSDGDAVNLTVPVAMLARMDAESSDLATLDRTELWKHSFALLGQPRKCVPCKSQRSCKDAVVIYWVAPKHPGDHLRRLRTPYTFSKRIKTRSLCSINW